MRKYVQKFVIYLIALSLANGVSGSTLAAGSFNFNLNLKLNHSYGNNQSRLLKFAEVDLSRILPYILRRGDQLKRVERTRYRGVNALKLIIFNVNSGRVVYVYIDADTGRML